MKTCDYCGRENSDEAAHCRECGTPFVTEEQQSRASEPRQPKDPRRIAAEKKMLSGAISCAGGILVTLFTYLSAVRSPFGGTYIVAWGAMIFGAVRFFQGLCERDKRPAVVDDNTGYNALSYGTRLEAAGRIQDALVVYQQIVEKYPDTDAARDAKRCIENIHAHRG